MNDECTEKCIKESDGATYVWNHHFRVRENVSKFHGRMHADDLITIWFGPETAVSFNPFFALSVEISSFNCSYNVAYVLRFVSSQCSACLVEPHTRCLVFQYLHRIWMIVVRGMRFI